MNIYATIRNYVNANGTANGLLSGRIYSGMVPQSSTYPAAVVNLITSSPTNTKTQASDLDFLRVQIDIYAETLASVDAVSDAIRGAIDYATSEPIRHIEFRSEMDGFSGKPELYRRICEYSISYAR